MASSSDQFKQAIPFHRPEAGIYYVALAIIGGFFLWNIFVSVVVDSFMRIKKQEEVNALITQDQAKWVRTKRYIERFPLISSKKTPKEPWRRYTLKIFDLIMKDSFEYFILGCIIVNVIFMMSSYEGESTKFGVALWAIDIVFVVIYWMEAVLKIIGLGWRQYFRDWWNVFDFLIIIVSVFTIGFSTPGQHHAANGIRLVRVIRVVRLLRRAPVLRALFMTLVYAAPSLLNIGLLLFVVFFIWGIFGMELFGKVVHNDGYGNYIPYDSNDGISNSINFENFGRSLLVLYRIATNDNWGSILLATGAHKDRCPDKKYLTTSSDGAFQYECGHFGLAVAYFVSFSIFGTLVMVNLFIAVILDTYSDNIDFEKRMVKLEPAAQWLSVWKEKDKEENGRIRGRLGIKNFIITLKESPVLVGLMLDALNLRLNIDEDQKESDINYDDVELIKKKSVELYGRVDFVGHSNAADIKVTVTNDHINAILTSRRLRLLCRLIHRGTLKEKLVIFYDEALFAIASLVVGPEFRMLPYATDRYVHISDWWEEEKEETAPTF
ncbi:sodium channel protein type 9 subunit alpha [Reticulomyxa filosa]|uniref:Sodium channel protein type 9 subunit alpha n=1 Tax=Reticulomyxa filosa TaxID=46433 RepID=X6LZR4_RETFI|nr:sodium channel protein type 9 subunit alpha [Reticulomyxa filosa]|eukprot:ETO07378.1 sodium channel protein type 9 subunit alpha [Reticulomyxa filosa]